MHLLSSLRNCVLKYVHKFHWKKNVQSPHNQSLLIHKFYEDTISKFYALIMSWSNKNVDLVGQTTNWISLFKNFVNSLVFKIRNTSWPICIPFLKILQINSGNCTCVEHLRFGKSPLKRFLTSVNPPLERKVCSKRNILSFRLKAIC